MANQNQNPIGNNGSLEDCHTNLYALTDIAGIQYKKFVCYKDGYVNSLDDPILILYTKCLQTGILSSWNKAKKDEKSNLADMSGYIRELWIFWYDGNDPFSLKNITIPNALKEDDHGNWKNGLTYEIRCILFKALNTNFERYFLSKGFVRMGPWIQMPYRSNKHSESQYGFNVKFFLHGESTICGAIDVRNVAMVRQITMRDLMGCNNHYNKEVLLSPYAVRASITGRGLKDDDINVKQLHEEWLKYYPLVFPQSNNKVISSEGLNSFKKFDTTKENPPKFIEVITGSCKMKYPSCLVCVKMEENEDNKSNQKENRKRRFNQIEVPNGHLFSYAARRFSDRILKEIMIPLNKSRCDSVSEKSQTKQSKPQSKPWKYCDPFWKSPCSCKRSSECDNLNHTQSSDSVTKQSEDKTATVTFHRKLQNFDIPFTKTNFTKDDYQQFDFNSSKQVPASRLDASCDRSTSPLTIPNDPIMPTLSPQLPSTSDSSSFQQHPTLSTANINGKLSSIQSDHITNEKMITKKPTSQIPINNHSRTPPPPSITTSSSANSSYNFHNVKTDNFVAFNDTIHQTKVDNGFENNFNGKIIDSLPSAIEFNQKQQVLSTTTYVATNMTVVSKRLLKREPIHWFSTENIEDIHLFPPIATGSLSSQTTTNDFCNSNGNGVMVNYGQRTDGAYQESLINNSWLTMQSHFESFDDCCSAVKRLKSASINYNNNNNNNNNNRGQQQYDSNYDHIITNAQELQSINARELSNKSNSNVNNLPIKSHKNYTPASIEKIEKTSLMPDQIFDDSDEDDNNQRMELSTSSSTKTSNAMNSCNDKILSPNNSQMKVVRSSNSFNKYPGTSLLSSGGAGCVTAMELSLMYPTPPSLEGIITAIGSPVDSSRQQIFTPSSNSRNLEYNHSENLLNGLSLYCQNWEEMDKDWSAPPLHNSLFSSGAKYSKQPELPKQKRLFTVTQRRLQLKKNKPNQHSMNTSGELKFTERCQAPLLPSYHHLLNHQQSQQRPNNLFPLMSFVNPQCLNLSSSRLPPNGTQRHSLNSGQNSAPVTPASACTNPPSVESSIGTPRNFDFHNQSSSTGFSRTPVVQSSPITAKSPRTTLHNQYTGPISSNSVMNQPNHTTATATTTTTTTTTINVNSLYFNVLLSDSILNVYKDHNFDSCNICICSMSVMGNDIGLYIDNYQQQNNNNQQQQQQSFVNRSLSADDPMNGSCSSKDCSCGFSTIMNRHYALNANLFYEDEVEITGIRKPHVYRNQSLSGKEQQQYDAITKPYGSQILSVYDEFGLSFLLDFIRFKKTVCKQKIEENIVEFQDFNIAIYHALEQSCESTERVSIERDKLWLSKLHYFKKDVIIPKNYNDQIRLLMTLRPLLQEAVSNTRLLESSYTVDGPLTWKTFHRLAGRGKLESCEPQPLPRFQVFCGKHSSKEAAVTMGAIPGLLSVPDTSFSGNINQMIHNQYPNNGFISAQNNFQTIPKKTTSLSYFSLEGNPLCLTSGYPDKEKECLTISPYAVREWDKLNLEPIFRPKEVAYAIVTPTDSGKVLQKSLITYFKELNNAYKACRLGHHFSFRSEMKDDIHSSFIEINTEYWNDKGVVTSAEKISLQPLSIHKYWMKELSKVMSVSSAEDFIGKLVWYVKQCEQQTTSTLHQYGVHKRNGTKSTLFPTCDSQNASQTLELLLSPGNGCGQLSKVLDTKLWSSDKDVYLVIYLVNPFTHGQDISEPTYRLSNQWMNKLCHKITKSLNPSWKSRITFQLLSINKIFDATQFGANVGVGDNDGSSIGGRDSSATSCTSSTVSWSVKWCRQWNWKSTAFAVYSSVRRKICRVSGLQSILLGKSTSVNLCSSAKCSMARGCSSDDECESAASIINANRCQTKCGPAGFNEKLTADYIKKFFLESHDQLNQSQHSVSIYAPPYILAPSKNLNYQTTTTTATGQQQQQQHQPSSSNANECWGYIGDKSNVLFVAYCLSVDQRLLLATCTDLLGTIQRQVHINIVVPQLHLRKKASPRRIGLGKLWDFVQEVVSDTCQPWRVVIGRLGRSGHGELKSWNGLLSRQNLIRVNQKFRDECSFCHVWASGGHGSTGAMGTVGRCDMCALQIPTIISGCFVSLESHSSFRIFPGSVKPEERASSNLPLCTPRDISVTHILVFPTSTSAGAIPSDQDLSGVGGGVNDMNLEELLKFGNEGLEELGNIGNIDMTDNMVGFSTDFDSYGRLQVQLLPRNSGGGSGCPQELAGALDPSCGGGGVGLDALGCFPPGCSFSSQEEGHMLMQQPLAMGYYLSTTEPGPLPSWFYSACPPPSTADSPLPSCFKAALHLQTSLISQEDPGGACSSSASGAAPHPLDSHQTSDVLRFVLESYHALSWLTFDPSINDRRSCLPIHFLFLAQLYQADQSFFM